jgi:ABC-type polysaccharide/polyol phosphate transport system ATPase subunit
VIVAASGGPAVSVRGLWDGFRPKSRRGWRRNEFRWALRDVSFDVAAGEMFGVIGHNGSGKSTLLFNLSGVYHARRGEMEVRQPATSLIELSAGFSRELTGRENIVVSGVLNGLTLRQVEERYDEIVAFTGLDPEIVDSPVRTYSSGMGLRVGFAVAVHTDPAVLLVDEVLAVGDEAFQEACLDKVRELREGGCAVVIASHDLGMIEEQCDRVGVLDQGELRFVGHPTEAISFYREHTASRGPAAGRPGSLWRDDSGSGGRRRPSRG